MKVTFRDTPQLLRVGDIGESIAGADESFRRQFSILVLGAVRNREIPLRNKNGFRIPLESLDITERQTRDFVARPFLEKLGDFDGDLQRARETAAAQPWIQQHYDIEAKLQAYANEYEKSKQHIEPEIQRETNRLLDDWYRDASVLVSEAAEWFCKAHDFEGATMESSVQPAGEIAQKLARWFDSPIGDLPPKPRRIVELYIPSWQELSANDRRARAAEADLQVQATLSARFEKANREKEQANAAIPARFLDRDFRHGFNKVKREKKGERDFEVKRGAVNLSDVRCIELARKPELGIVEWIELTGVGIGECHGFFLVATDGVSFIKHEQDFIESACPEDQIYMLRDNQHEPLKFPCTPARMIDFIDSELCTIRGCFSVPDTFQQAVTEIAPPTNAAPQVPDEAQEQAAHSGAIEKAAPEATHDDGEQDEAATLEQGEVIDHDAALADLFNAVKVPQLEAMFPDGGKWKSHAERANRNGLKSARTRRGEFNPYLAAAWWINSQGPPGWKWERCLRVLANNLPARSINSKHLLTGEFD